MPDIVVKLPDVAPGRAVRLDIAGRAVLLCRSRAGLHATDAICPHQNRSLDGARVRGTAVLCPWHGAMFDLATGISRSIQLTDRPLAIYPCRESEGSVSITLE